MSNGSQNQRYLDALSGQYGGSYSGYYGGGPIQSYTRPISVQKRMQLTEMYSNPSQGKAVVDQFGRLLGYEKEGTNIMQRAQDRLFAQLTGATAAQLTGQSTGAGGDAITTFLTPTQMEYLNRLRGNLGLGDSVTNGATGEAATARLSAPGMSFLSGAADAASPGIPRSLSPKALLGIAAAVLVVAFLARR